MNFFARVVDANFAFVICTTSTTHTDETVSAFGCVGRLVSPPGLPRGFRRGRSTMKSYLLPLLLLLLLSCDAYAQNLLKNPDFDRDLSGWEIGTSSPPFPAGSFSWSSDDALGNTASGSLTLESAAGARQCVSGLQRNFGPTYYYRAFVRSSTPGCAFGIAWSGYDDCSGAYTYDEQLVCISSAGSGEWEILEGQIRQIGSAWVHLTTNVHDGDDIKAFDSVWFSASPPPPFQCALGCDASAPSRTVVNTPVTIASTTTGCAFSKPFGYTIDFGDGYVVTSAESSATHAYAQPGTYTWSLRVTGTGATCSRSGSLAVTAVSDSLVAVTRLPSGMVQPANVALASDWYALVNTGTKSTQVSLSQTGDFFMQSPSTFTLAPGATQRITITALPKPAGMFTGSSLASGVGVPTDLALPIQLLVVDAPAGNPDPIPGVTRTDVAGPSGTNPTGSVAFTNRGASGVAGFLSTDSPWIVPESGPISINPGETKSLTFSIDRSKRSDAAEPIGSAVGKLNLNYLGGPAPSLAYTPNGSNPPTTTSVVIVDAVTPATSAATPPAIAAGELALFIPSVTHKGSIATDVVLSNVGSALTGDLRMFYSGAGSATSTGTSIAQLLPNVPAAFSDIVKSIFGNASQTGTLQLRTRNAATLSAASTRLQLGKPAGTFGTATPVLRSDQGIAAGSAIFLTGLQKDGGTHTDVFIQEVGGATATLAIEYFDAAGGSVGSRGTSSVTAFGLVELTDSVPAGAVAARIASDSGSTGRIGAHAIIYDDASGDMWSSVSSASTSGALVIPEVKRERAAGDAFTRTDVAITNTSATESASATLRLLLVPGRNRAIRRNGTGKSSGDMRPEPVAVDRSLTLGPLQTLKISDLVGSYFGSERNVEGFVTLTPSSGSFAVSSRTYTTAAAINGTIGTSVQPIPVSSLLTAGQARRMAGIEDAAATTGATPATYSTDFALLEAGGGSATVRVTLRYSFPLATVQAFGHSSREFTLAPRQFLLVEDIGRAIIGAERETTLGDLHNMQVDFEVTSGTGAVGVFTVQRDNGSGDTILRVE